MFQCPPLLPPAPLECGAPEVKRSSAWGQVQGQARGDRSNNSSTTLALPGRYRQTALMIPKCICDVSDHLHFLVTLPSKLAVREGRQLMNA